MEWFSKTEILKSKQDFHYRELFEDISRWRITGCENFSRWRITGYDVIVRRNGPFLINVEAKKHTSSRISVSQNIRSVDEFIDFCSNLEKNRVDYENESLRQESKKRELKDKICVKLGLTIDDFDLLKEILR